MKNANRIHIGTSGWHYEHWSGPFYPEQLPSERFLQHYIQHFASVEINNSFYQLPAEETLISWREEVPDTFIFSVKASRYITHMKKLKDPEEPLETFFNRMKILENQMGPVLFQLPPRWKINVERLKNFLEHVPRGTPCTFEFRDSSWFDSKTYEMLARYSAAFCIYDLDRKLSPLEVTADFVYVRLHGPEGPYQGQYAENVLADWAKRFVRWADEKKKVYCYFDNDQDGYAAQDALRLKDMIEKG